MRNKNKVDLIEDKNILKKVNMKYNNPVIISTLRELMLDDLIEKIESIVTNNFKDYLIKIPYEN